MRGLPGHDMESFRTSKQLYRLVYSIAKRNRKMLPATAVKMRDAASGIGGKLGRSAVPVGGPARQLRDRARALARARYVRRALQLISQMNPEPDPEVAAALEIVERVSDLIQIGR